MNNKELMKEVIKLDTQTLQTREQSERVMVQIAIIRKTFGVKNWETDAEVLDFERKRTLSDQEIEKEFKRYVDLREWAVKSTHQDKIRYFENRVYYFIEGVRFFDKKLAQTFMSKIKGFEYQI